MSLAQRLLAANQPVIVGTPCPGYGKPNGCKRKRHETGNVEFHWPHRWQRLTADQCDISKFREGKDALALIAGHGIDVVDEDTKDGGSVDNLPPFTNYGVTRTPSGGRHFLVPGTGLGKVLGLKTDDGLVGDYAAGRDDGTGRMLVYLPGSTRPKYPGGAYVEEELWEVEKCLDAEPEPDLLATVGKAGGHRETRERYIDATDQADTPHPYAVTAVKRELARLDECDLLGWDGPHWDATTYEVACNLHEFGNSGWSGLDLDALHERFLDRAPTDEAFGRAEHEAKWESARKKVDGGGRPQPSDDRHRPPEDDFTALDVFDETETLQHVRTAAYARTLSPRALLLCVLSRIAVEVPHRTALPPVIGSRRGLNLGVALVGVSGGGKSMLFSASRELLGFVGETQRDVERVPGSGEGLIQSFLDSKQVLVTNPTRLFYVDEIGQLGATKDNRSGSTLGRFSGRC